jgi:hypothetical protein
MFPRVDLAALGITEVDLTTLAKMQPYMKDASTKHLPIEKDTK